MKRLPHPGAFQEATKKASQEKTADSPKFAQGESWADVEDGLDDYVDFFAKELPAAYKGSLEDDPVDEPQCEDDDNDDDDDAPAACKDPETDDEDWADAEEGLDGYEHEFPLPMECGIPFARLGKIERDTVHIGSRSPQPDQREHQFQVTPQFEGAKVGRLLRMIEIARGSRL